MKKVVVVGAGLGGLAAALRLRARGYEVTVFEAGPTFGGKMNRWCSQGFSFDTGPSLITMPWVFADLFRAAGARMEDHVELLPLHPLAEYIFPDGTRFTYSTSLPDWLAVVRNLDRRDIAGFLRFQELGARLYEVSRQTFLRRAPSERPSLADLGVLRKMPLRYGWGNYHRTVAAHFHSPHLRQMFDRYPTYVGSSPYRAPATLALIPYLEYAFGGYAVRGGLYSIVEALVRLAQYAGVALCANSPVARIETDSRGVTGVALADGRRAPADIVIMNGDSATLDTLLGRTPAPLHSRSMSGFVMLLGLKRPLGLQQNTICFSADYQREFHQIFDEQRFPDDPTVYINAPGEGDALFVMANAPGTASALPEARARVFERLRRSGFPDLSGKIVVEDTWTPERIAQRYLMPGGSIYGTDSHGWRNAFFRPANRDKRVPGLYRVGGSTHPGGGTPTVLLSAEITCRLVD